jgi:hypothetical protein
MQHIWSTFTLGRTENVCLRRPIEDSLAQADHEKWQGLADNQSQQHVK